jgi:LacI family transcriptional regulator
MLTEPNEQVWNEARLSGVPMVVLDADLDATGVDSVLIDNECGAGEAIAHLLSSVAPARCYFVGGPRENFDTVQRAAAFTQALKRAGHRPRTDQVAYGKYSPDWGRTWAASMLATVGQGPIGVMAADDEIALGVMDALRACGAVRRLVMPGFVGFDDSRLASLLHPALSSVRVPLAEVGAAAIEALINRIERPRSPIVRKTLPTQLVIRESSRAV